MADQTWCSSFRPPTGRGGHGLAGRRVVGGWELGEAGLRIEVHLGEIAADVEVAGADQGDLGTLRSVEVGSEAHVPRPVDRVEGGDMAVGGVAGVAARAGLRR